MRTGIIAKKANLHPNIWVIYAPKKGPINPASVNPAAVAPNHFPLSIGLQSKAIIIQTTPSTPASPNPWIDLKKISKNIELLRPHNIVENKKIIKAGIIIFFGP